MRLFDKFKKMEAKQYTINLDKNGLSVDGVLIAEMTIPALTSAFGEMRIIEPESKEPDDKGIIPNTVLLWDNAGIRAYTKDVAAGKISELSIRFLFDEEWKPKYDRKVWEPRMDFSGTFLIASKPALEIIPEKNLKEAYLYVSDLKFGNWQVDFCLSQSLQSKLEAMDFSYRLNHKGEVLNIIRSDTQPFSWVYVTYNPTRVSTGKYNQIKLDRALLFDNFNFKLAIIEELMYNQNLIKPKFDVYDFAEDYTKREIDVESEGYRPIREVKKYFEELSINSAFAEKVKQLSLDGGNEVYQQIVPQWDGEDNLYDLEDISQAELSQFPNLKLIEIVGIGVSKKAREALAAAAVEICEGR